MDMFTKWFGVFCIVVILFVFVLVGLACLADSLKNFFNVYIDKIGQLERRKLGTQIAISSHWFSEDKNCQILVKEIGNYLSQYGDFNDEHIRNIWRNSIAPIANTDLPPKTKSGV